MIFLSLIALAAAQPPAITLVPETPPPPPAPPFVDAPPAPPPVIAVPSPEAVALPPPARKMVEEAIRGGNDATIASVAKLARALYPSGVAQIDALVAEHDAQQAEAKAKAARAKAEALANAAFLDNWKGEVEAGASHAGGNTKSTGIYGSVNFTKEGLRWKYQATSRVDYQRTDGVTTAERLSAAWQLNYKIDDRLYALGLGQYEHDRLLGYNSRFTAGAGIGYGIVRQPKLTIDFEGGPAVRYTEFTDQDSRATVAGRASLSVKWKILPTLDFSQDAAVYLEQGNDNATATTSLDTKLIGALKARFSYNLTYERDAPLGRDSLDTLSRATLVYSF